MIEGNKNGPCKLCGKDTQLCKSHIVPEFCLRSYHKGDIQHLLDGWVATLTEFILQQNEDKDLNDFIRQQAEKLNLRGGGSSHFAQGVIFSIKIVLVNLSWGVILIPG